MRTPVHAWLVGVCVTYTSAGLGCSVDAVTFTPGDDSRTEDCDRPGDEDGNGTADCDDPACAGEAACQAVCGNGEREAGEACDDGNSIDGDGCETTCVGTGSGSFEAIADAMVRIVAGTGDADTNFGPEPGLVTFGSAFGTVARSVLAFDVTALPPGTMIWAARLNVRLTEQAGVEYAVGVHRVTEPWSETSVTWNTQPGFDPTIEASLVDKRLTWWRFELTSLVQRWVDDPSTNHGLALIQDPEEYSSGGQYARFASREDTNRPYLEIIVGN